MSTKNKKTFPCKLEELIREYQSAKKALAKFPDAPTKPKLKSAYSISEWQKEEKERKEFDLKLSSHEEKKKVAIGKEKQLFDTLRNFLPKGNTWFVTENGKLAVAIQYIDWHGARPNLLIRENPVVEELPKIETVTVN